jgi:fluoride exporter
VSVLAWVGVAALGSVGALMRFRLDGVVSAWLGSDFPRGTLAINVSGSFLLGLLFGLGVTGVAFVLAGTATLGSYTTFSTWMFETQRSREDGEFWRAGANVLISLLVGFAAVALGKAIG